MSDLYDRIKMAKEELRQWANRNPDNGNPGDTIFGIANSSVPIYDYEILQMAMNDLSLAIDSPESGPAFDGSPSPINIIAGNILEMLRSELWGEWREIESEREAQEEDETED